MKEIYIIIVFLFAIIILLSIIMANQAKPTNNKHLYYVVWICQKFEFCSPETEATFYYCTPEGLQSIINCHDYPPQSVVKLD